MKNFWTKLIDFLFIKRSLYFISGYLRLWHNFINITFLTIYALYGAFFVLGNIGIDTPKPILFASMLAIIVLVVLSSLSYRFSYQIKKNVLLVNLGQNLDGFDLGKLESLTQEQIDRQVKYLLADAKSMDTNKDQIRRLEIKLRGFFEYPEQYARVPSIDSVPKKMPPPLPYEGE